MRRKPDRKKLRLFAISVAAGLSLTALTLVSVNLMFLAAAGMIISGLVALENRRRTFWEQGFTFRIRRLETQNEALEKENARTRNDIDTLRAKLSALAVSLEKKRKAPPPIPTAKLAPANTPAPVAVKPVTRKVPPPSNTENNHGYSNMVVKELIRETLRSGNIEAFMQPIVRLPNRQIRMFEMFGRVRAKPGLYLPAGDFMDIAARENVMIDLDRLLLAETIKAIKETAQDKNPAPFILNVSAAMLASKTFMNELLPFLARHKNLAPRLVLEIKQAALTNMAPGILEILRGLARLGCSLSLDDVTDLDFDLKYLSVLNVRFIKIHCRHFMNHRTGSREFANFMRIKSKLESNGVGVIALGVERDAHIKALSDYNIHYAQGYAFGKPESRDLYLEDRRAA